MKTEKLGGVAGGEGECGDDVAGWLVRERRLLLTLVLLTVDLVTGSYVALMMYNPFINFQSGYTTKP